MTKDLIEIKSPEFDVDLDIRYATKNNVTGSKIYDHAFCYLHPKAAKNLQIAIKLAKIQDYKFKIFDCFRPFSAQEYLFKKFPNGGFVSDPKTGSIPHCRGVAIDLTLINSHKEELVMGTEFDNFTDKAHHGSTKISAISQKNRYILMGIMISAGWEIYEKEWWHYQLPNSRSYSIIEHS